MGEPLSCDCIPYNYCIMKFFDENACDKDTKWECGAHAGNLCVVNEFIIKCCSRLIIIRVCHLRSPEGLTRTATGFSCIVREQIKILHVEIAPKVLTSALP